MSRYVDIEKLEPRQFENSEIELGILAYEYDIVQGEPYIDIVCCEECIYADEKPIADGRYWCALHQCFMYFCSDGKRRADNNKECHKPESEYYRAYCKEQKEKTYCEGCKFWY